MLIGSVSWFNAWRDTRINLHSCLVHWSDINAPGCLFYIGEYVVRDECFKLTRKLIPSKDGGRYQLCNQVFSQFLFSYKWNVFVDKKSERINNNSLPIPNDAKQVECPKHLEFNWCSSQKMLCFLQAFLMKDMRFGKLQSLVAFICVTKVRLERRWHLQNITRPCKGLCQAIP